MKERVCPLCNQKVQLEWSSGEGRDQGYYFSQHDAPEGGECEGSGCTELWAELLSKVPQD